MTHRTGTHALYRFYGDDGALLYVGISFNPSGRFTQHKLDKPWWHEVRGISVEPYPERTSAEAAERRAIAVEHPRYNKARPALPKATRPTPQTPRHLVWVCETCREPVADDTGYLHVVLAQVHAVERFWATKDNAAAAGIHAADWSGLEDWPTEAHWQVHHAACDPEPDSFDYHYDVAKARTHAQLLARTSHLLESKNWLTHTDWWELIARMAGVTP